MSLSSGTRLGPYEIVAPLGAGGMGEVYRARDTKLNRDVALKILPEAFAADPDRLMRFTREAQTLASLNHPNIAAIYGIEESESRSPGVQESDARPTRALVMELVEGEDLSTMIFGAPGLQARGMPGSKDPGLQHGIPLGDALPIARQIAEALEAAHEAGIIHRDLKPANIKVRADGTVKVLDFGLAKALDSAPGTQASGPGTQSQANSPTMTSPALTAMGLILGTAAYMSPEQAKGRPVDRRADIWAFGVVLLEMLTGERCFKGDDVSETLASVLKDRPPIDSLPAGVPPRLTRLLERCLDRDPRRRLRDMGEARIALEALAMDDAGADGAGAAGPAPTPVRPIAPWVAAALLAGLALGWMAFAWLGGMGAPGDPGRMMRLSVPAFAGLDVARNIAPAADDRFVVYQGETGGASMLYLHDFESGEVQPLAGTEGAENPFLSPDGLWVGFRQGTRLMKRRLSGGDAVTICEVPGNFPGATWTPDNTIVFPLGWLQGLSTVSADGGEPVAVTTVNTAAGEKGHWWPRIMPDGRHALFTIWNAGGGLIDSDVAVVDLQTGEYRKLVRGADAWFLPPGHLVYYHAGSYQATTLDPGTLEAGSESVPVLEDATDPLPQGTTELGVAISARGTLFYLTDQLQPLATLAAAAPGRAPEPLPFPARALQSFALSPDGQTIAASSLESGVFRMRLLNLNNGIDERLDVPGSSWLPYWKRDNSGIAFVNMRKGDFDIYFKNLDGTAADGPIRETPTDEWPYGWSADGAQFFFTETLPQGSQALRVRSERDPQDEQTIMPRISINSLTASADGRWIAYDDTRDGQENVYVRPYPGPGAEVRVSPDGGGRPAWSADGTELYYAKETSIVVVPFTASQGRFQPGPEQVLLTVPLMATVQSPLVVRGRRTFIVALREKAPVPPVLQVVLNWAPIKR